MMRLRDSVTLAWTKLRLRRVRTAMAVGVSGLVFGVLLAGIVAIQGVVNSINLFSEGFNSRYIVEANSYSEKFEHQEAIVVANKPEVIQRVGELYAKRIVDMKTEAKLLNVQFDPKVDEPSPVTIDPKTKNESIVEQNLSNWAVQQAMAEELNKLPRPTALKDRISEYDVKQVYPTARPIIGGGEGFAMLKMQSDIYNKEATTRQQFSLTKASEISIASLDSGVTNSFSVVPLGSLGRGEVPVVIPFTDAERLLGLKLLDASATSQQRIDRLKEVNSRIDELVVPFCYRNSSSLQLVSEAKRVHSEVVANEKDINYKKPSLIYGIPDENACGQVEAIVDTRPAAEKKAADAMLSFRKKFDSSLIPVSELINFRSVGVVPSPMSQPGLSGVSQTIAMMMYSSLQFQWTIPSSGLASLPSAVLENQGGNLQLDEIAAELQGESKLVEFRTADEALEFMRQESSDSGGNGGVFTVPFANASLAIAQVNFGLRAAMPWVVLVVSIIASLILAGIIGRTIADSRKETAVFRAIGATRGHIASIYVTYTLLLSIRIVIFSLLLALAVVIALQAWQGSNATLGARLAFSVTDDTKQFSFIGMNDWYILVILGVIVASSLLSMTLPLARNVRRNPIKDMRDDG